jgi:hypothetical protein
MVGLEVCDESTQGHFASSYWLQLPFIPIVTLQEKKMKRA